MNSKSVNGRIELSNEDLRTILNHLTYHAFDEDDEKLKVLLLRKKVKQHLYEKKKRRKARCTN